MFLYYDIASRILVVANVSGLERVCLLLFLFYRADLIAWLVFTHTIQYVVFIMLKYKYFDCYKIVYGV